MAHRTSSVVICGAGIAGISAAYHLAVKHGVRGVVLVDEGAPMSLTSDKSTEAYRNWWPGPDDAMLRFMNRSIDLLEELDAATEHRIRLNRRGYLYATGDPGKAEAFLQAGQLAEAMGAGPLRVYRGDAADPAYAPAAADGWRDQPMGADLFLDPEQICQVFPYLTGRTVAALHARRCGWFSGQQLGMVMLEQARAHGVELSAGRVTGVDTPGGRVQAVRVATADGAETIATPVFVDAAGPLAGEVAALLGLDLPIFSELHLKLAFEDRLGAIPRTAPLVIWEDEQVLPWSEEEREALAESAETRHLLAPFPGGVHFRPEGGPGAETVLLLWAYHLAPVPLRFPVPLDPEFPEIVLRGMSTLVPALAPYLERLPKAYVDGGYYTKTRENRPLIGPLPMAGAYVYAALSGYGLMGACAGGELLAAHITGAALPPYAPAFDLRRYDDAEYQARLLEWGSTGQL
jgi:glycine/D-amino acid oxidase-like deaminating enzyme